ncbi:MAG TPA: histidine kinase [Chitinophagaceae bacterium]|nr:histidine kinase [Chitinophagaceae bacterium]
MILIPHIALVRKHLAKIVLSAFVFWLLIGFLVYLTEYIAYTYFGAKMMDEIEQKQYLLRWVLWLLFTPIIILLALRINIGNCKIVWFVILHIFFGTLILALDFFIELSVLRPLAEAFYKRPVVVDELIIPFLYKYFGYIINYFLIVGIVNIYVYMNTYYKTQKNLLHVEIHNQELNYQLTLAKLQSLKMQIHPHFLFNAHQSILGLILNQENEKAANILSKLSDLLRLTLERQEQDYISLEDELKANELYLEIQKIRFGERLKYSKMVAPEALKARIPYFILQPIVENAIKYGVEKSDDEVIIQINAYLKDNKLYIEVINTGDIDSSVTQHGFGIGLKNIENRMNQYYANQASFSLKTKESGQTMAQIILPYHEA